MSCRKKEKNNDYRVCEGLLVVGAGRFSWDRATVVTREMGVVMLNMVSQFSLLLTEFQWGRKTKERSRGTLEKEERGEMETEKGQVEISVFQVLLRQTDRQIEITVKQLSLPGLGEEWSTTWTAEWLGFFSPVQTKEPKTCSPTYHALIRHYSRIQKIDKNKNVVSSCKVLTVTQWRAPGRFS